MTIHGQPYFLSSAAPSPDVCFHSSAPIPSIRPSVTFCCDSVLCWAQLGGTQSNENKGPSHLFLVDLGLTCCVTLDKLLSLSGPLFPLCTMGRRREHARLSPPVCGVLSWGWHTRLHLLLVILLLAQGGCTSLCKPFLWCF